MFKFDGLIDDKDVVKLHYALAGLRVFNLEVRPASNVKAVKNGKAEPETHDSGTMPERVAQVLRTNYQTGATFSRQDLFNVARSLSYAPNSLLATALIKAKIVKKKSRGAFVLLPTK